MDTVVALIFAGHTAEYHLAVTVYFLQCKLGLTNKTIAYDNNLACSGFVYGLLLASNLITSGVKPGSVLMNDNICRFIEAVNPSA